MGQAYDVITQLLSIFGVLIRFIGVIVFGLALGWLTLAAFKKETTWHYQAVLLVVFFGFFAAVFWHSNPGMLGGLTLGTGAAVWIWGIRKPSEKVPPPAEVPPAEENKRVRKVA